MAAHALPASPNGPHNKSRPYLLFTALPATGHTYPMLRIASSLLSRGFEASFIGAAEFAPQITRIGATHIPIPNLPPELLTEMLKVPVGIPHHVWALRELFTKPVPGLWMVLMGALESIREERPGQEVVVLHESLFLGAVPMMYGAPLPKGFSSPPPVININIIPYHAPSIDTAPWGPGLPPDSTPSGRARNQLLNELFYGEEYGVLGHAKAEFAEMLKSTGATKPLEHHTLTVPLASYDLTLQMCSPSLEYPRSDMLPGVKFAGCIPLSEVDPGYPLPGWWDEITSAKGKGRKVVGVAQGTMAVTYSDVIMPTITALASRSDILLIAILGKKGANLPADFNIPSNTRVVDFLPYDTLLKHADVWVTNGGYGGFTHGIMNGVPMVLGGITEDKGEVAMRGEWAGVAVNLKTAFPTPEMVAEGVDEVLGDGRYRERCLEIKRENEELRPLDAIEGYVWECVEGR